eukprot:Tamp_17947.p1 GENE.Tamp_17947~~Tamp_17947.p1  ORF type:complete len:122 (+),score=2.26 Tamp_17947:893-1258(+)
MHTHTVTESDTNSQTRKCTLTVTGTSTHTNTGVVYRGLGFTRRANLSILCPSLSSSKAGTKLPFFFLVVERMRYQLLKSSFDDYVGYGHMRLYTHEVMNHLHVESVYMYQDKRQAPHVYLY